MNEVSSIAPVRQQVEKEKLNIPFLLVGFFAGLFIVGILGYLLVRVKVPVHVAVALKVPTPTVDPSAPPAAQWHKYFNTTYQYVLQFPPNLHAIEKGPEYVQFSTDVLDGNQQNSESYISMQVVNNPTHLKLADWTKSFRSSISAVTLFNQPAYVLKSQQLGDLSRSYFLANNGNIFQFALVFKGGGDQVSVDFTKMLTTLSFGPQSSPSAVEK